MSLRFDATRRFMGALLAALLLFALAVPACLMLVCMTSPMSGDGLMGGMSVTECVGAAAALEGLPATSQSSARAAVMMLIALIGFMVAGTSAAPLSPDGWVRALVPAAPPPPMSPRGERLLV